MQEGMRMSKRGKDRVLPPPAVFIIYIAASALVIAGFHLIYPGEAVPLACFSAQWRLIRFLLDFIALFPALVLSSLVIPFGFKLRTPEISTPFSPQFFQFLKSSVITVIVAAVVYGVLFVLILPLGRNYEANLRSRGQLYGLAKERAQEHAAKGDWAEAAQFVSVCEGIWPNGPEISKLKAETDIQSEALRFSAGSLPNEREPVSPLALPGPQPVNATEALAQAQTALNEGRYYDALWLTSLAGHMAKPGSVEQNMATRLAGIAWNGVNSMAPNAGETKAYDLFRMKRDGYEAMLAEDWVRSYYIFLDFLKLSPKDPDAIKFLNMSEKGLQQAAFFTDEMDMALADTLFGAVYSLPSGQGRLVLRLSSLSLLPDSAYGMEMELMAFDRDGRPLWSMEAPYVKLLPLVLDSGSEVSILMRALDRTDKTKHWEPVAHGMGQGAPANVQMALPVSWDDLLLLSKVRRGFSGLSPAELERASEAFGSCGYQPEQFQAELLRRFSEPLFLLPLGIFAIVIGWRYRAIKRPGIMRILMLGILPLVFSGLVQICRLWITNLEIAAVVSLGFTAALVSFAAGLTVFLIFSLIILAAQHD